MTTVLVVVGVVGLQVARVQRMPQLEPWHRSRLAAEFEAGDETPEFSLTDYLEVEARVFAELDGLVARAGSGEGEAWCRYVRSGRNNPTGFPQNWNRTFELEPAAVRGHALLLHGLTDSPYSFRALGNRLVGEGFHVVGLRLPGHGTVPGALARATRQDWAAAVRVAARSIGSRLHEGETFLIAGYSNGGALAVGYALQSLVDDGLPRPDRIVLLSPAIGITAFARLASWHRMFTFLPYFQPLAWSEIGPEYDPYKYVSFPMNAATQTHKVTRELQAALERAAGDGRLAELPPILSFVSIADATVLVEAVVEALYNRLQAPSSELVVFDINRAADLRPLLAADPSERIRRLLEGVDRRYRLTAVTNATPDSDEVVARSWAPGGEVEPTELPTGLSWPEGIYSLSHVAIPFPADDWVYGRPEEGTIGYGLRLGLVDLRGERGLLRVPPSQLLRLRSNPFYSFLEERVLESVVPAVGVSEPAPEEAIAP